MKFDEMINNHTLLVTGGAGYIGSHTVLCLLEAGYDVVVIDNLSNSHAQSLQRVEQICDRKPVFIQGDIRDRALLDRIFAEHRISAVIHFAGLKAVAESVENPLIYYDNNVTGTLTLCRAMTSAGVFQIVFSSSATVYGDPMEVPIIEDHPTGEPTSPYGRSKLMIEQILRDLALSDDRWSVALLRYFNPTGAHESGLIGEDPQGIPNNLVPYICQVAVKKLPTLSVYGNDYPTSDGTGVRDYIHAVDLACGHLRALEVIRKKTGVHIWNLGTGKGHSVLEMVHAFKKVSCCDIPYVIAPRRLGDVAACWADPGKANRELQWKAKHSIERMMEDVWRWQSQNPNGYRTGNQA